MEGRKIGRLLLTLLLSVAMIWTMMPASVLAYDDEEDDEDYEEYVNLSFFGESVFNYDSEDEYDEEGNLIEQNEGPVVDPSKLPEGVTFDMDTRTLTLNNVTLKNTDDECWDAAIFYTGTKDLTIKLIGKNLIQGLKVDGYYANDGIDIFDRAGVNVIGTGSLEVKDCMGLIYQEPNADESSFDEDYGDFRKGDQGDIYIEGVTLKSNSEGVFSQFSNLSFIDSSLTVDRSGGGSSYYYGFKTGYSGVKGNLTVKNSTILIKGGMTVSWVNADLNGEFMYAGDSGAEYRVDPAKVEMDSFDRHVLYKKYVLITPEDKGLPYDVTKCKITYNVNGGNKLTPSSKTVNKNGQIGTLPTPKRSKYVFTGWYTKKSGGTKVTASTVAKKSMTIYAHWKKGGYITYKLNGGKNNSANPSYYYSTKEVTFKAPTRTNYNFKGWYTDKNFKNKITKIKKGSAGNKTVYAKWAEKDIFTPADTILSLSGGNKKVAGTIMGGYKKNAKYTSSNTSVVTVSKGVLTPKSVGAAYITIKSRKNLVSGWVTKKIAVTVNSNDLYKKINVRNLPDFKFKSKTEARDPVKIYCPQGLCVTEDFILVSAYNTAETESSRIYAYDKYSYEYAGYFDTGTIAHVGGLTYDADNRLVLVSNEYQIQYFTEDDLYDYLYAGEAVKVKNIEFAPGVETPKNEMKVSTLTWHDGRLWVALYLREKDDPDKTYNCDIRDITYTVENRYDNYGNREATVTGTNYSDSKMHGAYSINGIIFDPNDEHTMYLTSSTGRSKFSVLYRCTADPDTTCGTLRKVKDLPSMAEGIAFLNDNMLILYESCSDRYQDQGLSNVFDKDKKKVQHPMNYLTVFNRKHL